MSIHKISFQSNGKEHVVLTGRQGYINMEKVLTERILHELGFSKEEIEKIIKEKM